MAKAPHLFYKAYVIPFELQLDLKKVLLLGEGPACDTQLDWLLKDSHHPEITFVSEKFSGKQKEKAKTHSNLTLVQKIYSSDDLRKMNLVVIATPDAGLQNKIINDCKQLNLLFAFAEGFGPKERPGSPVSEDWAEEPVEEGSGIRWMRIVSYLMVAFGLMVVGHVLLSYLPLPPIGEIASETKGLFIGPFGVFVLTGFLAQLVDGALGMGFGLISATCLTTAGMNPVTMSAAVHTTEIFASGISGYSHYRFGNVNKKLFRHLLMPGVFGAALGAVALVLLGEHAGKFMLPIISFYALALGVIIILRGIKFSRPKKKTKHVGLLASAGGFLDSFGGGGWGPIVTSTLLAGGRSAKYTVGSVSLTEFFVTLTSAFTFFLFIGTGNWPVIAGLLLGSVTAAPIAARLAGKLPARQMLIAIGILVIIWSLRLIIKSFF